MKWLKKKKTLKIVKNILAFNRHQQRKGLKILTPSQLLSRLPIPLAQLKAENNSEKLKNEIRQILYSFYRSKKLAKQLYKGLIDYLKMETIFMNSKNKWTKEPKAPHGFRLNLTDRLDFSGSKKLSFSQFVYLLQLKNITSEYNNNKFNISAPTWNVTLNLLDGSYSISDIPDYFEFIMKKHETLTKNPPVQIYSNKAKNRSVFKIKTDYKLELLTPEIIRKWNKTRRQR